MGMPGESPPTTRPGVYAPRHDTELLMAAVQGRRYDVAGKRRWSSVPGKPEGPRRVTPDRDGPLLLEGPVECDTSHHRRAKRETT